MQIYLIWFSFSFFIVLILFSHRNQLTQIAQLPTCTLLLLRDTKFSSANGKKGFGRFMRIFGHIPFMETNISTRPSTNHPLPPTSNTSAALLVDQMIALPLWGTGKQDRDTQRTGCVRLCGPNTASHGLHTQHSGNPVLH